MANRAPRRDRSREVWPDDRYQKRRLAAVAEADVMRLWHVQRVEERRDVFGIPPVEVARVIARLRTRAPVPAPRQRQHAIIRPQPLDLVAEILPRPQPAVDQHQRRTVPARVGIINRRPVDRNHWHDARSLLVRTRFPTRAGKSCTIIPQRRGTRGLPVKTSAGKQASHSLRFYQRWWI